MRNIASQGQVNEIVKLCTEYKIKDYTINPDGSISVNGDVDLINYGLAALPLKFDTVTGDFDCCGNRLTTLMGCPITVGGSFQCDSNRIESLFGCPRKVGKDFFCGHSHLTSLQYAPEEIPGDFSCSANEITSIDHMPKKIGGTAFFCVNDFSDDLLNITIEQNDIFCKYQKQYDVWAPDFNEEHFRLLIEDIKDGLE